MTDDAVEDSGYCSLCGMPKIPSYASHERSWFDDHEELMVPKGTLIFCFRHGDTTDTFWQYLRTITMGLNVKSRTASAIRNQRGPEWIRQCALEEMAVERNVSRCERYETIAAFCRKRAKELGSQSYDPSALLLADGSGGAAGARRLVSREALLAIRENLETIEQSDVASPPSESLLDDAVRLAETVEALYELIDVQLAITVQVASRQCMCKSAKPRTRPGGEGCSGRCLPARAQAVLGERLHVLEPTRLHIATIEPLPDEDPADVDETPAPHGASFGQYLDA